MMLLFYRVFPLVLIVVIAAGCGRGAQGRSAFDRRGRWQ